MYIKINIYPVIIALYFLVTFIAVALPEAVADPLKAGIARAARISQVIIEAGENPTAISIGTRTIQLDGWNRNRRKDNVVCDPDLTITRIDTATGEPLAVLINWTAHPTLMGSGDMMFSGGWPGHLQRTVEALIGQGVAVMYYNGAQGDQSPVPRKDSGGSWERAECYGRELGITVWREWQGIELVPSPGFSCHIEEIELPECTPHKDFMNTGGTEYGLTQELMKNLLELLVPSRTHSISLRIGDLLIAGIPGEMIYQLGMSVRSPSREPRPPAITKLKTWLLGTASAS